MPSSSGVSIDCENRSCWTTKPSLRHTCAIGFAYARGDAPKLREELRRKGVVAHAADEAITEAFLEEETSDEALAREVALKWIERGGRVVAKALTAARFSEERERSRRRLYAFLSRRGFAPDAIRSAFAAAVERAADI